MKLSILILTHNRPKLFLRCITSILNQIPENMDLEIIVNNDSKDIQEIKDNRITYFYKDFINIGEIYNFLFNVSTGDYIYYLEDDDYLVKEFFKILFNYPLAELYYMNYKNWNIKTAVQLRKKLFSMEQENNHFQLSQILFKKTLILSIPTDNNLDNDWVLFQSLLKNAKSIVLIKEYMFIQTCDGKDNISFPQFNKDIRWNMLNKAE